MTDFATTDLFVSSLDHEIETRKLTVAERADRAKARQILMQSREYVIEMYLCRRYKYNGPESYRIDKLYTGIEIIRIVERLLGEHINFEIDLENPTFEMLEDCITILNVDDVGKGKIITLM
tara:strand:- start:4262 stop:4624 length:363 start_codon:yes stop_codon:yes gene_type:complete